jgi:1-deoxy-D-xylulose-5-phosphate synthase
VVILEKILSNINSPEELKKLPDDILGDLAHEIRQFLIKTVSKTGGHLASNLGVVELTIALHRVFDTPQDKIIWDVGHQSYVHKILTGRRDKMLTLRQYAGLSGFPKRNESLYDTFDTGHSSTSISAALGIAKAKEINKDNFSVIAVIGDGAMTGGMAFEALNHAGHLQSDIIVILNDNEMSISHNVGGLSAYLTRIRTDPTYFKVKSDIDFLLSRIPAIGKTVARTAERLKDSLKYLLVPGVLFEELGFTYLGPVDGHNIPILINQLKMAKKTRGPVLLHVMTKKGKGYVPAEKDPDRFHGIGPFDIETGQVKTKKSLPSYSEVFGKALVNLAEKRNDIVSITAAMPGGTGLKEFCSRFPNRFIDVGIAEQHAVTLAAGMATAGVRPIVAVYSTFIQRAYDQLIHDVCLQNLPVVFALDRAGLVGEDGETHQGSFDISFLRIVPNMTVMAPKDQQEFVYMINTAVNISGPCAIRYPRGSGPLPEVSYDDEQIPIGVGEVLRQGTDVAVFAIGSMVFPSLKAADYIKKQGIRAAVINSRFVKPLDENLILKTAKSCKCVVTVEENTISGGFGNAVGELLERKGIKVPIRMLGIPDKFISHGNRGILLEEVGLTPSKIAESIKNHFAEV